jgi:bacterial membrane protein
MLKIKKVKLLAFIIPIFIFWMVLISAKVYPFGEKSILVSDLSNEYIDYLSWYKNMLMGKHSFMYSWNFGMGMNMFSTIFYFLSSPLNILILVPFLEIQDTVLIITLLKIGLCGLTCNFYLSKKFGLNNNQNLVFSTCYALMSFNICYIQHLMWFDGIILLPILIFYLDEFIEKDKKLGLILTLIISFYSNFYISYMIGLFMIIYFWYRFFSSDLKITLKSAIIKFVKFGLYSISSLMICGIFLLPTYISLEKEKNTELFKLGIRYRIGDIISKLFIGNFDTLHPGGSPNIYCGLIVLVFFLLYFINKNISIKKKISAGVVLIIMFISIEISFFYMMWHGFDNPEWFEGRFSFLVSFFLIYIASESYEKKNGVLIKRSLEKISLILILLLISSSILIENLRDKLFINLVFIILYCVAFKINLLKKFLLIIVCCELLMNGILVNKKIRTEENYEDRSYYIQYKKNLRETVNELKRKDNSIYRTEKDFRRRENEGALADYKGIAIFDSNFNKGVHNLLSKLGMPFFDKVGNFEGTTLFSESLLGVKYVLSHNIGKTIFYSKPVLKVNDTYVFKNNQALPFFSLVNEGILSVNINKENENPFELQNKIAEKITNNKVRIFENLNVNKKIENLKVEDEKNDNIKYVKINPNKEAFLEFKVSNLTNDINYMYIKKFNQNTLVEINGINNPYEFGGYNKIFRLNNDDIVKISLKENELEINKNLFYSFNKNNYNIIMSKIDRTPIIKKFNDTYIEVKIENIKENELLMTSIPYDEGWKLYVNGKKQVKEKILGAFIGIRLKNKESNIILKYEAPGVKLGVIISLIGLVGLIILSFVDKKFLVVEEGILKSNNKQLS